MSHCHLGPSDSWAVVMMLRVALDDHIGRLNVWKNLFSAGRVLPIPLIMSSLMSRKLAVVGSPPYCFPSGSFPFIIFSLSTSLVLFLLVLLCFLVPSVYSLLVLAWSLELLLLIYCSSSYSLLLPLYIVSLLIYCSSSCMLFLLLYCSSSLAPMRSGSVHSRFNRGCNRGLIVGSSGYWLLVIQIGGRSAPSSRVVFSLPRGRISLN
jgi:hypothetical protein